MKKTRPYNIYNHFLKISTYQVNIKFHTENQPPSLLNSGDIYEGDLKIRIWKTTSKKFQFFSLNVP